MPLHTLRFMASPPAEWMPLCRSATGGLAASRIIISNFASYSNYQCACPTPWPPNKLAHSSDPFSTLGHRGLDCSHSCTTKCTRQRTSAASNIRLRREPPGDVRLRLPAKPSNPTLTGPPNAPPSPPAPLLEHIGWLCRLGSSHGFASGHLLDGTSKRHELVLLLVPRQVLPLAAALGISFLRNTGDLPRFCQS